MKKILSILKFKKEANLLGAKVYMIKSMVAIITAYGIAMNNSILRKDMISVLFGLMLTIEPSILKGFKQGLEQVYASIIGGITAGIIVYLLGINVWTVSLSVVITLYICIKINWKIVSPVAIFTAIYMTQYVQKTEAGTVSMLLTFKLRMFALLTGVLIALFYNFIFALFSYKELLNKRITFLLDSLINSMRKITIGFKDKKELEDTIKYLPEIFDNIDSTYYLFEDIKKENKIYKLLNIEIEKISTFQKVLLQLRNITHLEYDTCYILLNDLDFDKLDKDLKEQIKYKMKENVKKIKNLKVYFNSLDNYDVEMVVSKEDRKIEGTKKESIRLLYNVNEIEECIISAVEEGKNIR